MTQKTLIGEPESTIIGVENVLPPVEQLPAVIEEPQEALVAFADIGVGIGVARKMATQLADIIDKQKLSIDIKGKKFIFVEAWCACAAMCGISPRTVWCRRIEESGKVVGYEARVEVVRLSTNEVIGAAEAECWMDEKLKGYPRWTENHSAKAMAQTRATSRAIAQILRWIPVLAGYSGTPAEDINPDAEPPVNNPTQRANAPAAAPRGRRVDPTDIGGLVKAWKAVRPPDASAEEWAAFVEKHAQRRFDCTKAGNWTETDLRLVKQALEAGL